MSPPHRQHRSPNFGPRQPVNGTVGIRHLMLHYTGMRSAEDALTRLCDQESGVSAHYLIDEDGTIYALVDEGARAWHAGVAFWGGIRDLNSTSIGIELVNPGHDYGYRAFPSAQIAALITVAKDIMVRHRLGPAALVGHSDVAPGRKQDPGELFPWATLAAEGIGLWPRATVAVPDSPWPGLAAIGYATPNGAGSDILDAATGAKDVVTAFQRRFRQSRTDGELDTETRAQIAAVAAVYGLQPVVPAT